MDVGQITLIGRWVGIALIVLTWVQAIPLKFGWFGFGLAAVSFITESIFKKNLKSSNPDSSSEDQPGDKE